MNDLLHRDSSSPLPFERYHVPIIVRTLRALEFLAQHPEGCSMTELSAGLKIPKNTAFRILNTLADYGYLTRDDENKVYRLDRKLLNLGYAAIDESSLVEKSIDVMRDLRDLTGESIHIAVRLENEGLVLEQVPGFHPIKVLVQIGHRFPLYTSAPGKALLAGLPEHELDPILKTIKYKKLTETTLTSIHGMRKELTDVRRCGYALDRAEEIPGLHCIGAAVLNHRGYPLAAIWVGGLATALPEKQFETLGEQVTTAARKISTRFGYRKLGVA